MICQTHKNLLIHDPHLSFLGIAWLPDEEIVDKDQCRVCNPKIERDEAVKLRGYFEGIGADSDKCHRCGTKVDTFSWEEHDNFHARTDREHEEENGYGIFSEHYKQNDGNKYGN